MKSSFGYYSFMDITLYRYIDDSPIYYTYSLEEEKGRRPKQLSFVENKHLSQEAQRTLPFVDRLELEELVRAELEQRLQEGCRVLYFYAQSSKLHSLITDTVREYRDRESQSTSSKSVGV